MLLRCGPGQPPQVRPQQVHGHEVVVLEASAEERPLVGRRVPQPPDHLADRHDLLHVAAALGAIYEEQVAVQSRLVVQSRAVPAADDKAHRDALL